MAPGRHDEPDPDVDPDSARVAAIDLACGTATRLVVVDLREGYGT